MFIGRKEELRFLEERYHAHGGQLVILYGRRRVGKTETLRKFCEGKAHVFFSCTESPDEQQLTAFSERILQKGIPAANYIQRFTDWEKAITSITTLPGEGKKLLVIDEFPYMVKGNHAIPSILQNLWDSKLKDEDVMIILCGSAMAFMEKEVLAEKNPLYGRTTGILQIKEMDFFEAAQFVPAYSAEDKIATYAVLGGIPHYLKQFDDHLSLEENIRRNILTRGSILYSEVEFLMRQALRETAVYNTIIEAVALGNTKLNDIYQKTQIEKTKLSVYLKNLMELGILRREFSMSEGVKEQANVQRGLYRVADNYFRFWYAFVFPNMSELETGDVGGIWQYVVQPEMNSFVAQTFEGVCQQYLRCMNRRNLLPLRFTKIGRWWNKTDELDILAVNRQQDAYLLGECKYKNGVFTDADLINMKKKFKPSRPDAKLYYYLFSKGGFSQEVEKAAEEDGLNLVTPEAICRFFLSSEEGSGII